MRNQDFLLHGAGAVEATTFLEMMFSEGSGVTKDEAKGRDVLAKVRLVLCNML